MPSKVNFKIRKSSMKNVQNAFDKLVDATQKRVNRKALIFAKTPVLKAAKANAPFESGALKKSLTYKVASYKRNGITMVIIGADRNYTETHKGKLRRPANYSHLVEFGTARGVRGTRFLTRATDSMKGQVFIRYKDKAQRELDREALKIAAKHRKAA